MAHAVWRAVAAQMSGGDAASGAVGAFSGEMATRYIASQYFGADTADKLAALNEHDRETLSLLGTLAAGLAGGMSGNSSAAVATGAQAGKNAVENNALSSKDEQKRQDAKWSLPYIKDEQQKQQAEKLISDLNAKDKAFDEKLNAACQGLSSTACQGMRQELSTMAKSYDEQLDGQYIGNMGTVYKEGKGQIDISDVAVRQRGC